MLELVSAIFVLVIFGCAVVLFFKFKGKNKKSEEDKNEANENLNKIIDELKNILKATEQNESFELDRAKKYRPEPNPSFSWFRDFRFANYLPEPDNSSLLEQAKKDARLLKDQKPLLDYCKEKSRIFLFSKEYKKALIYLDFASSLGDVEAMYNLGICYFNGLGVKKNESKGSAFFLIAAEKEKSLAIDSLRTTQTTENVQNVFDAFCKFSDETKSNLIKCAQNVGDKLYLDKAAAIYDKGAEAGDEYCKERAKECSVKIGDIYYSAYEITNQKEYLKSAIFYYNIAAKHEDLYAQVSLGLCYLKDGKLDLGLKLIKPAAERGDGRAQYYLGRCYEYGVGVKNFVLALDCYKKAAQNGIPEAKERSAYWEHAIEYFEHFDVNRYRFNSADYQMVWKLFSYGNTDSEFDPYVVLKVDKNASPEELKSAYLMLNVGLPPFDEDDSGTLEHPKEIKDKGTIYMIAYVAALKKAWDMIKKERGL